MVNNKTYVQTGKSLYFAKQILLSVSLQTDTFQNSQPEREGRYFQADLFDHSFFSFKKNRTDETVVGMTSTPVSFSQMMFSSMPYIGGLA